MAQTNAAYMSIDDGTLGCERNHHQVWNWLRSNSKEWAIVLEDDAEPVDEFRNQITLALEAAPTPIVSFYLGKHHIQTLDIERDKQQAIARADTADAHWITGRQLLHAVAVAVHRNHLVSMLNHLYSMPAFFPIDEAISHWVNTSGMDVSYTWPSLADHADQPTLFRHHDKLERPPGRVAYRTGTRPQWNDSSVTL